MIRALGKLLLQGGVRVVVASLAIGDADTILARIAEYVDAGVSKFILRPLGGDDDTLLAQTRRLIEQVVPRAEARWPKHPKTSDS
jgi:alkanesulfonate monooxygenase SsuD/methylene tetrahydromethanopterin reductase-like flavin-dependent oxidoreductase (luciferase family)